MHLGNKIRKFKIHFPHAISVVSDEQKMHNLTWTRQAIQT